MRFGAPGYLWLLPALPLLVGMLVLEFRRKRRALELFGDLHLMRRLMMSASLEKRVIKAALLIVAAFFLILALARPQWGAKLETVTRRGVDVMVVVDTSTSMLAEDVKPNRLAQARAAVSSLIDLLEGDRVGIVAFAGAAYVACPLTLDYAAARMFVDILDTDLIPTRGSAIAASIRASIPAFESQERRYKVLILITDGEDHEGDLEGAGRAAAAEGIIIHAVGVGSPEGEPIPLHNARGDVVGYKEDREGRKVTSRLDERALESIAALTGGKYFRSTPEGIELRRVYEEISRMEQKALSGRLQAAYEERYQIPLGVAIALLALEACLSDRRGAGAAAATAESEEAA